MGDSASLRNEFRWVPAAPSDRRSEICDKTSGDGSLPIAGLHGQNGSALLPVAASLITQGDHWIHSCCTSCRDIAG